MAYVPETETAESPNVPGRQGQPQISVRMWPVSSLNVRLGSECYVGQNVTGDQTRPDLDSRRFKFLQFPEFHPNGVLGGGGSAGDMERTNFRRFELNRRLKKSWEVL
jgi:hypothetical protein